MKNNIIKQIFILKNLKNLQNQNLTIISAMPHTHLAGTAVYTKLIRNGKDIGYVFNIPNYDFNYQQTFTLTPYVTLTKV
jgi:hypothetical protein